jgi:vacuolar-type H+-ATPase subunit I/STV1
MIVQMAKVRILGPRARLDEALRAIQRVGLVQITEAPTVPGLTPLDLDPRDLRRRRQLHRLVEDTQACLEALAVKQAEVDFTPAGTPVSQLATWARLARRVRRSTVRITAEELRLNEERALIQQYRDLLNVLAPDLRELARVPHVTHAAVIPASERAAVEALRTRCSRKTGTGVAVKAHALRAGTWRCSSSCRAQRLTPTRARRGTRVEASLPAPGPSLRVPSAQRLLRIPANSNAAARTEANTGTRQGCYARAVCHDILAQPEGGHARDARLCGRRVDAEG